MPIIRHITEEEVSEASSKKRKYRTSVDAYENVQSLYSRISEIERKIEIVKSQQISEEAKSTIIHELEEEKKRLEEDIRKIRKVSQA